MKTPINPYLEDIEEENIDAVAIKTAPQPAPKQRATSAPEMIANPFLDDDDEFDTLPRATPARAARPKQSAPQSVSTPEKTIAAPVEKPSGAPRANKNTAPREHPKPKLKLDVPSLPDETERSSTENTAPVQPAVRVEKTKTPPYHITPEYRNSLTPEQKTANKQRKEAVKQAKKDAYARGERPWETKKSAGTKKKQAANKSSATPAGHKKRDPNKKYNRRDITPRDLTVIHFIAKFRYSTSRIMAKVLGVKEFTAYKRLLGLEEFGYTARHNTGLGYIWTVNQRAISALEMHGWDVPTRKAYRFDPNSFDHNGMKHSLAIQWVALQAVRGELANQRNGGRFPTNIQWEQVIPEQAMRAGRQVLGGNVALRKSKEEDLNKVWSGKMTWQEMFEETPAHWIITGKSYNNLMKIPDMAISFEHSRKSDEPISAAFEVELTRKSPEDYRQIFKAYAQDRHTYTGVIYVTDSERTAQVVREAAQDVGFTKLQVLPLLDDDGNILKNGLRMVSEKYDEK